MQIVTHSDSSSADELVKLEVRATRNFRDIEPSRKNQPEKTHDEMLHGKHSSPHHLPKSALQETTGNHIIHVVMCVLLHSTQRSMGPLYESTCLQEFINKVECGFDILILTHSVPIAYLYEAQYISPDGTNGEQCTSYTLRSKGAKWHLLGFFGLSLFWHPQTVLQRTLLEGSLNEPF